MLFRDRIGVVRQTMHGLVFTWALFVRLATRVAGTLAFGPSERSWASNNPVTRKTSSDSRSPNSLRGGSRRCSCSARLLSVRCPLARPWPARGVRVSESDVLRALVPAHARPNRCTA
jgi:hypothetical protein